MTVAVLVPVLQRPHRVNPLLASITAATSQPHTVVFVCDPDDDEQIAAIEAADHPNVRIMTTGGSYARKINEAVHATTEPFVFTGADDLHFRAGWLEHALAAMAGAVQVVGVNDLLRRRRAHATHFLIAREYAMRPCVDGTRGPMCEAYDHSFVDDELIATAAHRSVYAYAERARVEHRHWLNRRAPDDEVYRKGRLRFDEDRALFRERSQMWT